MSQTNGLFYWFVSSGSFFLLTQAEKRAFNQLKAVISAYVSKNKTVRKQPVKRTAILGHVNRRCPKIAVLFEQFIFFVDLRRNKGF